MIAYYSGWLQKPGLRAIEFSITDGVMTGFMTAVHGLDRSKGLDLVLHTPGGEINATEALVNYLRYAFKGDIRALIPHQAMSAGTMIALACKSICMGMHSSLGPIDPQVGGAPAHGILEEFSVARELFKNNPQEAQAWLPILQKYTPTLIGKCERAVEMAEKIVAGWLEEGMLREHVKTKEELRKKFLKSLVPTNAAADHARHYNYEKVRSIGVVVERLEDDSKLQDALLTVHHAFTVSSIHRNCRNLHCRESEWRRVRQPDAYSSDSCASGCGLVKLALMLKQKAFFRPLCHPRVTGDFL